MLVTRLGVTQSNKNNNTIVMDYFKDIRPYRDDEIRPVVDSLLTDPELITVIGRYFYPRLSRIVPWLVFSMARALLRRQLKDVCDVVTMQDVIAVYMDKMIDETTISLTHEGVEKLSPEKGYLFISNHRDIAMDPAFVNYVLYHLGYETIQIAIGDNLLKRPFVSDIMRLNKSFIVRRSLKGRELLSSLRHMSEYIHHCVEENHNVWIAQREGRAKDGVDRTDPALIKMLTMGRRDLSFMDSVDRLNIVPVSISYEYDGCDVAKAEELYQLDKTGEFSKTDDSDINSIVAGMTGYKGRVHIVFGNQLELDTNDPEKIAASVDRQIVQNYKLRDSNYIALELLRRRGDIEVPELSPEVTQYQVADTARDEFLARLSKVDEKLHGHFLAMYANPVISRFRK